MHNQAQLRQQDRTQHLCPSEAQRLACSFPETRVSFQFLALAHASKRSSLFCLTPPLFPCFTINDTMEFTHQEIMHHTNTIAIDPRKRNQLGERYVMTPPKIQVNKSSALFPCPQFLTDLSFSTENQFLLIWRKYAMNCIVQALLLLK